MKKYKSIYYQQNIQARVLARTNIKKIILIQFLYFILIKFWMQKRME